MPSVREREGNVCESMKVRAVRGDRTWPEEARVEVQGQENF